MAGEITTTIVGNTTSEPELRFTANGVPVVSLTIAHTPRRFDRQRNEWVDEDALFLRATAWREFAEHIAGSLTKGTRVIATGRLKQRSYQDREGVQRSSIELELDALGPELRYATAQVTRAASNNSGGQQSPNQHASWDARQPGGDDAWSTPGAYGDDTPF